MLDLWKRWVQFHELYVKSSPEEAPQIDLKTLVPHWLARIKSKDAVKLFNKESAAIRVVDAKHDKKGKTLALLLQYTDKNVTDPAFSHLETGELRVEPKLDGEGIAVSAHVLISLVPHDPEKMLYRFLLEEVPGLGRSRVSDFIRSELKIISDGLFDYKDPDDGFKVKAYLPAVEILGTPSKKFTDEIEAGCVVQGIELVKFAKGPAKIDEEGYYVESSRILKLTPAKEATLDALMTKVKGLAKKEGYADIKFRYKHPGGKQKTATMNGTQNDTVDTLVLRSEEIKSDVILAQCSIKLVASIIKGMKQALTS